MKSLTLAIACLFLVGCDQAHPPVILNLYKDSIKVTVLFKNGPPALDVVLEQNGGLMQRQKGLLVEEIKVIEPSGNIRFFKLKELDILRAKQDIVFKVWSLSETGIELHDKDFYRAFLKTKTAARNKPHSK